MTSLSAPPMPTPPTLSRRSLLGSLAAGALGSACSPSGGYSISVFEADITPPLGTPFLGGVRARSVVDPLFAKGLILHGAGAPLVLASLDWCEIRNESYERWREALASAAGTTNERVLVTCVHQHDAPYVDAVAQQLLEENDVDGALCDLESNEEAIESVAAAVRNAMQQRRPVTSIGAGRGETKQLVSNRRYLTDDGAVSWGRTSATRDPALRAKPPGLCDPWVRSLSFWDGDEAVAAISAFSIHPMSYYGDGDTSADFVGMARGRLQQDTPGVMQIYVSGCSGDTIAGIYNDGSPEMRPVLADRLYQGMAAAWQSAERQPIDQIGFRSAAMRFEPRRTEGFSLDAMRAVLADSARTFRERYLAALGLSWRQRVDAGHAIDVPCIDFGPALLVLLPAESFVQYQLWAQELRPDALVLAMGYGECAPGYIPTAKDADDGYDDHYSWVAFPECESTIRGALGQVLTPSG